MKKMQKKDINPEKGRFSSKGTKSEEKEKASSSDETKGILSKINGKAEKE